MKITGLNKKKSKVVYDWLYKVTDLGDLIDEISSITIEDGLIYGYNFYDYVEEIKLCMRYQNV